MSRLEKLVRHRTVKPEEAPKKTEKPEEDADLLAQGLHQGLVRRHFKCSKSVYRQFGHQSLRESHISKCQI